MALAAGSSPLARGLRPDVGGALLDVGIIPARAGFTGPPGSVREGREDHPRSRGVYSRRACAVGAGRGSSPLARGLRTAPRCASGRRRIIPARAGFTTGARTSGPTEKDHPRSRGVYAAEKDIPRPGQGSSPLARGLLTGEKGKGRIERIIPARAGFTREGREPALEPEDHPRSRGVYNSAVKTPRKKIGSSPLARGLQPPARGFGAAPGIIPARAGFTSSLRSPSRRARDHPRSRGVYPARRPPTARTSGSSPLARGLRHGQARPPVRLRIIPARAGFTQPPIRRGMDGEDHPRSRGVYSRGFVLQPESRGSSPLARGLPNSTGAAFFSRDGSSPLARGLRSREPHGH